MNSLAKWSIGDLGAASPEELVVLAPYESDVPRALAVAQQVVASGRPLRIVGRGVTLEDPERIRRGHSVRLCLTELDAYLPYERARLVAPLVQQGRQWLEGLFKGLFSREMAQALWASAANRLLLPTLEAWPVVVGLGQHHPAQEIRCVRADWVGLEALRARAPSTLQRVEFETNAVGRPFRRVPQQLEFAATAASAVSFRLIEFHRQRGARKRVAAYSHAGSPSLWLGVVPGSAAMSRQTIAAASSLAARGYKDVGVLLQGHFEGTARGFESVEAIQQHLNVLAVEQVVGAPDEWKLIASVKEYLRAVPELSARLSHLGEIKLGEIAVDPRRVRTALHRLLSIDILRALEAQRAAEDAARRHDFAGTTVLWPHASLPNMAAPDLALAAAGARTFELVHGAFPDAVDIQTYAWSPAGTRVSWSRREAELAQEFSGHQLCVGGVTAEQRKARPDRTRGRVCNILLTTNYAHGLGTQTADRPSLFVYQEHLLQLLTEALGDLRPSVVVRWRPHPHDDDSVVKASFERFRSTIDALSATSTALSVDLEWADIVISSWSSTVLEALTYPVAVFLHRAPMLDPAGAAGVFPASRSFDEARQLGASLRQIIQQWPPRDSSWRAADIGLREKLFGSEDPPPSIADYLATTTGKRP